LYPFPQPSDNVEARSPAFEQVRDAVAALMECLRDVLDLPKDPAVLAHAHLTFARVIKSMNTLSR
jgi:hypothetical protein